jgi:ketosteroid isomerase-like protein
MQNRDVETAIVGLERAALERWCHGDPGGFIDLAAEDIVYFDPFVERRVDGRDAFVALMESIRGQVKAERFELIDQWVHVGGGLALLTFNFVSWTGGGESRWNASEVYRVEGDSWVLVHQHWSLTRPTLQA